MSHMLKRDPRSNAILNDDLEALNKYKQERDRLRKMASMEKEIKELKEKVDKLFRIIETLK